MKNHVGLVLGVCIASGILIAFVAALRGVSWPWEVVLIAAMIVGIAVIVWTIRGQHKR